MCKNSLFCVVKGNMALRKSGTDPLKPAVNSDFTQLVITCSVNKHHLLSHTHVAFIKGGNHWWAAAILAKKPLKILWGP